MIRLALITFLASATPLAAQTTRPSLGPPAAGAIDPARLAAARSLMDLMIPPAQRDAMLAGMVAALNQNLTAGILGQPTLREAFEREPRARPIFDRFIKRQQDASLANLRANTPGMIDAISRAYARRFTTAQLSELTTFFRTPTGQAYMAEAFTIMSDPDIAAWQQRTMAEAFADLPADMEKLTAELKALNGGK